MWNDHPIDLLAHESLHFGSSLNKIFIPMDTWIKIKYYKNKINHTIGIGPVFRGPQKLLAARVCILHSFKGKQCFRIETSGFLSTTVQWICFFRTFIL